MSSVPCRKVCSHAYTCSFYEKPFPTPTSKNLCTTSCCTTLPEGIQYSESSVIRASIIWHLDYPNANVHKPHPHYKSHVGHGVFQSSKQCRVPKMYWLLKRSWVFATSWLQIDPIWSAMEVDNRLQLQKLERFSKKMSDCIIMCDLYY